MHEELTPNGFHPDALLTVKQVCRAFGVSRDWVYKHACRDQPNHLPPVRLGRLVRFKHEDVSRYIETRRKGSSDAALAATDGIAWANERRQHRMARKRFQKGYVRVRNTKKHPYWEGFYWEDLRLEDGRIARKQRAVNLGRLEDVPSKKLAEQTLAEKLAEVNRPDSQPRSVSTPGTQVPMDPRGGARWRSRFAKDAPKLSSDPARKGRACEAQKVSSQEPAGQGRRLGLSEHAWDRAVPGRQPARTGPSTDGRKTWHHAGDLALAASLAFSGPI